VRGSLARKLVATTARVRPCRLAADCTTRLGDADGAVPRVQVYTCGCSGGTRVYSLIHPRDTALDSPVQTGPVRVQEIDQVLELQVAGHPHILVHSVICCVPVGQ
jgi:hypothetical protein